MSITPLNTVSVTPAIAAPATRRRWAWAFALYTAAINLGFSRAIWVIYLAAHGYSPFAIGLFETCFHLAKFLAEVPTGVFADLAGRRRSLVVSCALGAAGELLFVAPTPPLIALSFALQGTAFAFRGGADSAILWSMAGQSGASGDGGTSGDARQTHRYSRLYSSMFLVLLASEAVGTATGGFLSEIATALPFICQGTAIGLGIVPALLLPERRLVKSEHAERPHPLAHAREGLRAAWRDPALLGLLLLSGLTGGIMTTTSLFGQLYFTALGFSIAAVGLIFAVSIFPSALFTSLAPRLIRLQPERRVLALCIGAETLGLLLMATGVRAFGLLGFLVLFYGSDALLTPAISTYLNARSPEAQRATVLSFDTGLFSAVMIVLFPLFGLGLSHLPFRPMLLGVAALLAGGALAIALSMRLLRARQRLPVAASLEQAVDAQEG